MHYCPVTKKQVWPTSSREFAVCTHWQIVHRPDNGRKAILLVSFSCPESDAIRPVVDGQVRGQAIISLVLLEEPHGGDSGCLATRLVSFDLAGSVSLHLTNIIIAQQAGLPTVVEDFLHRNEPVTPDAYTLPLTYDNAWQHVVSRVAKPQLMMTNHNNTNNNGNVLDTSDQDPMGEIFAVNGDGNGTHQKNGGTAPSSSSSSSNELPSLEHQAMLLLAPVLLHKMVMLFGMSGSSFVFALSVFCAVRQLVILHLGEHLGHSVAAVDTVTCRFSVDPKGMQRFVANKREEREELQRKTTSTEVVLPLHLVVSAVARALQETRQVCRKRVQYPMLLIDRVVTTYTGSVDVTVVEKDKHWTVRQVTAKSVTDIAKSRAVSGGEKMSTETCGQCLVVALDDSETTQLVIDATSEQRDIVVIAIIQGLGKINSQSAPAESFLRGRRGGSTFQVTVSLTIRGHSESLIQDAEAFALECQKMLQNFQRFAKTEWVQQDQR
jgi:hypothetical protein